MSRSLSDINTEVHEASKPLARVVEEVQEVVVGQRALIEKLILALLCHGHVLLEGVPGLAKTLTVQTLARAIQLSFGRVQFTPDLLPADLIGTQIYNLHTGEFTTRHGPIFAHLLLADEINRAPAKVQSALLEAMQERQVTIGDTSYSLPDPFLVLATQNPIDHEGTYPLPEAQLDRFMFKVKIDYPTAAEERRILDRMATIQPCAKPAAVLTPQELLDARTAADAVYLDPKIRDYIVNIVRATRHPADFGVPLAGLLECGASPRATINIAVAAKALAFLKGRGYVTPQDVKIIAPDVLRHRLIPSYEADSEAKSSDELIEMILQHLPVP